MDAASNSIVDDTNSNAPLAYTASPVVPADAQLTVDGVDLTSASNTVTNLIPGLTFQLLSPSAKESDDTLEQIQVVIGNDNTSVESAVNSMVNDYNSLISAINVQGGNDSSGNPEPLFGSPTLSLLQQQLLGSLNIQNPNGYLDSIATDTNTTLSGSVSIAVGSGKTQTIVIGSAPASPAADTFYTGPGSDYNTIQGLADAINAAADGTVMNYTGTAGTDTVASSGTFTAIPDASLPLSGTLSIQVGTGTTENFVIGSAPSTGAARNTVYTGDSVVTLSDLADAINTANIGVQATVTTPAGGVSTLTLTSATLGTDGTLNVTSGIAADGIWGEGPSGYDEHRVQSLAALPNGRIERRADDEIQDRRDQRNAPELQHYSGLEHGHLNGRPHARCRCRRHSDRVGDHQGWKRQYADGQPACGRRHALRLVGRDQLRQDRRDRVHWNQFDGPADPVT